MYHLKRNITPETNINKDLIIKVLQIIIVVLVLYYIYVKFIGNKKLESFKQNRRYKTSEVYKSSIPNLYNIMSQKCSPDYCNVNNWPIPKFAQVKLNDNEQISNTRGNGGCCVIPKKLSNYIYDTRGNNASA